MDVECVFVFVIEGPLAEKLQMFEGNLVFHGMPGFLNIYLAGYGKGFTGILFKGALPSSHRCNPDITGSRDEVQKHLFMITAQADYLLRIAAGKLEHMLDTARRIRSPVDEI